MKKLLMIVLALVMILPGTVALAEETEVARIEALCYEQELAYAVYTTAEGEEIPLEVEYTVSQLPATRNFMGLYATEPPVYAITATTKTLSGSADKNNSDINISINLTMTWIDGNYADNTIKSLNGGYTLASGELTSSMIRWGSAPRSLPHTKSISISKTSFDEAINYTSEDSIAGTLIAEYQVNYKGGAFVSVKVSPTIFN